MPLLHPPAAGIDGGAEAQWGCVPADRAAQPRQQLSALPCDVHRLADWLQACGSTTVAMASPGGDGMPLLQMLEARGFAGALVYARHVKPVPGRPHTERVDGRWLHKWPTSGV